MLREALDQVQAAIAAEDWARALPAALTAWRIDRSIELADLIDRITDRCTLPKPPHTRAHTHRWWMANAGDPDALMIGSLVNTFTVRLHVVETPWAVMRARWNAPNPIIDGVESLRPPQYLVNFAQQRGETYVRAVANWVDRVAAMYTWPDDPRVARVLSTLTCDDNVWLVAERGEGPWPAIADKLIALGDRRAAARFAKTPAGDVEGRWRAVVRLRAAFPVAASTPTPELSGPASQDIAAIAASVPVSPALPDLRIALEPLWNEVSAHPDDDAPRLVLADALLAAGDNRGELIVLQCSPGTGRRGHIETQANRLIKREWERWMGDLALVLAHRGTTIKRGMLDAIRVGLAATPAWAWDAIEGHRELGVVQAVRPAQVTPQRFAKLVASLPHFPRMLHIEAHEVVEKLVETHTNQPLEHVYYSPISDQVWYRRPRPQVQDLFRMLAALAPNLTKLDLGPLWWHGGEFRVQEVPAARYVEIIEVVKSLFPRLAQIRIEQSSVREDARPLVARIAGIALVEKALEIRN